MHRDIPDMYMLGTETQWTLKSSWNECAWGKPG